MHDVEFSKGRGRRGAPLTCRGPTIASATVRRAPAVKSRSTLGSEAPMVIDLSPKYTLMVCLFDDATQYLVGHDKSVGVFASIQGEVVLVLLLAKRMTA